MNRDEGPLYQLSHVYDNLLLSVATSCGHIAGGGSQFEKCSSCCRNVINPLTPELPQHAVPRPGAPRHNIICNSLFFELSFFYIRDVSFVCLYVHHMQLSCGIKSILTYLVKDPQAGISALREFVTVGKGKPGFGLTG